MENTYSSIMTQLNHMNGLPGGSVSTITSQYLQYLIHSPTSCLLSQFTSILIFLIACSQRFSSPSSSFIQSIRQSLQTYSTLLPLSPLSRLLLLLSSPTQPFHTLHVLHNHSADPTLSSAEVDWKGWDEIELSLQQGNRSHCQTLLTTLLQSPFTHPHDLPWICYDLLLLNLHTNRFIPLCQSLVQILSRLPVTATTCPEWMVVRPTSIPLGMTTRHFLSRACLLLILRDAPREVELMKELLKMCDEEDSSLALIRMVLLHEQMVSMKPSSLPPNTNQNNTNNHINKEYTNISQITLPPSSSSSSSSSSSQSLTTILTTMYFHRFPPSHF